MHRLLTIAISVVLVSLPLAAQDRAAINGTVTDPSGAMVGGATVELLSPDTGLRASLRPTTAEFTNSRLCR
jgi:hypothetical protein